jgi:DNA-binding CsgD family transcriptional regulator
MHHEPRQLSQREPGVPAMDEMLVAAGLDAFPLSVLTTALGLSLWVALGSFVLAVADGLGTDPLRRLVVGLVLVTGTMLALWQRQRVCLLLRLHPRITLGVAAAQLAVVAIDGFVGGPYVAFTLTSVGIAVVVAPSRIVWACVLVLVVGYQVGVLAGRSPDQLIHHGDIPGVLGQTLSYPFAAFSLLGLAALFKRFLSNREVILEGMRGGAPALTPALSLAIANPGRAQLLLPAGRPPPPRLTPTEVRVVEGLSQGKTAKQLAFEWGVALPTVRTHIRHAKRKTGARTLRQLAALARRAEWPTVTLNE